MTLLRQIIREVIDEQEASMSREQAASLIKNAKANPKFKAQVGAMAKALQTNQAFTKNLLGGVTEALGKGLSMLSLAIVLVASGLSAEEVTKKSPEEAKQMAPAVKKKVSALDKFKEEVAKEEEKEVVSPLNPKSERNVYKWLKSKIANFDSLEILEWGNIGHREILTPEQQQKLADTMNRTRKPGTPPRVVPLDDNPEWATYWVDVKIRGTDLTNKTYVAVYNFRFNKKDEVVVAGRK